MSNESDLFLLQKFIVNEWTRINEIKVSPTEKNTNKTEREKRPKKHGNSLNK